jgi:hypothetical protein
MTALQPKASVLWFSSVVMLFLSVEYWIIHSYFFNEAPELYSLGVAIDITVGIPALFYFLVVRPRKYSAFSLLPVFFLSLAIATFIIPSAHQQFLDSEKKLIPLIEAALIVYVFTKIPGFLKRYKEGKRNQYFLSDALESASGNNRIVRILLAELLVVYLAFAGWFKKPPMNESVANFTYHRKSAYSAILATMTLLLIVETVGLHLVLMHWSVIAANILTGLSIYGLIWLIGDYHAIRLHPVIVTEDKLFLRIGIRWSATIPINEIAEVEIGGKAPGKSKNYLRASVLWPRVVIHLRNPIAVKGLFGIVRYPSQIGLSIDDPELFKSEILKRQS